MSSERVVKLTELDLRRGVDPRVCPNLARDFKAGGRAEQVADRIEYSSPGGYTWILKNRRGPTGPKAQ